MLNLLNSLTRPFVVAHRGGGGEAVENTYEAFEQSVQAGVKFIETDVWLGDDGELYVQHGHLRDMFSRTPIKDIAALPRIEEVLRRYPNVFFSIDPKHSPAFKPLVEIILKLKAQERVCISSSFYWRSKHAIKDNPEILVALNALGIITNLLPKVLFPFLDTITKSTVIAYPPRWMAFKWLISLAHKNRLCVIIQKVDATSNFASLSKKGADGFMTDYPKLLLDSLNG